jgi:hypothetical protein
MLFARALSYALEGVVYQYMLRSEKTNRFLGEVKNPFNGI